MQDGPAGLREVDDLVSAFPAGISVAATWNRNLMRSRGQALGQEWKAKGRKKMKKVKKSYHILNHAKRSIPYLKFPRQILILTSGCGF